MLSKKLKLVVSGIVASVIVAATISNSYAATIYTQKEAGARYTRYATYNTFTMAAGAPSGGGGSFADRGTYGMFRGDGLTDSSAVPVRTDVHYYNADGSSALDWYNSNFVYCIHNRKLSPSATYYPEIGFGSVASYVDSSVFRNDSAMKDAVTRNGVLIILQNGFPVTDFGMPRDDAYSATAMAIRFWMAERERDLNASGVWTYLWNYNVYDVSRSGSYGSIAAISSYATLARNQAALTQAHALLGLARQAKSGYGTRAPSTLSASGGSAYISGNNFVFTTALNYSNLDSISWTSNLPAGSNIYRDGNTLVATVPKSVSYANKSYSITLRGYDRAHVNNFVFAPITTNNAYQALVGISGQKANMPVVESALTFSTPSIETDLVPSIKTYSMKTGSKVYTNTFEPGERVYVELTTTNTDAPTAYNFSNWWSWRNNATGTGYDEFAATVSALAGYGNTHVVAKSYVPPIRDASYTSTIQYQIDYTDAVAERNNTVAQNTASHTVTIKGRPDLDITSLSANKSTYNAGEPIVISTNVRNKGFSTSAQSAMTFKIDGAVRETRTIPALAASGTWGAQTFSFTAPAASDNKTYTINVSIPSNQSPTGTISRTISVTVLGLPDLAVVESTAQNYFVDKDVVISALVRNYNPIAVPEAEVKLTFADKNLIEKIPIPASGSNRAVFRIRTPVNPGQYAITIAADPDNKINETNNANNVLTQTVTVANENRVPMPDPDSPELEQQYLTQGKTLLNLSLPASQRRHSWQEIRLENGSYVTRTYWMQLDTVFNINPDPRVAIPGKPDLIESGFGIESSAEMVITTNYDRPDKLVGPQMVYLFYPEAAYGKLAFANYADSLEILNGTKGAHNSLWHYPISPFSLTGSRLHYTPLWTPDGSYDVMAQSFYAWSPVGQMYDFKSNSVTIEGDMYDRVTVVRR